MTFRVIGAREILLALALVLEGEDRKTAAETGGMDGRRCGTGCIATTRRGWPGCRTTGAGRGRDGSRPSRRASSWPGWRPVPTWPWTGWCAGGGGPAPRIAARLRGGAARADGGQGPGGARLPAALGAPAPSEDRSGGAGGFQKNFREAVARGVPEDARGKPLEVWFQDEARVGQQGTLTRVWAKRGTRPGRRATGAPVGLSVRRGLPRARRGRRPGHALRRHRAP